MRTERFDLNQDGSARLMVDIYDDQPAAEKAPALIHVPGGAFMMCVETDRGEIASRLVERGFRVSCTYVYPVGRAYRFPQVTIDLMKAIKLVRDHSDEWSVDPERIVISGGSAGAFICMTCGNLWNRPEFMASRSELSRTLMSEYGERGQGSAPPCELMWKKPLPAATQPPESFSSPGKAI